MFSWSWIQFIQDILVNLGRFEQSETGAGKCVFADGTRQSDTLHVFH